MTKHPVESKLVTPNLSWLPKAGLFCLEFKEVPTEAELKEYALFRANHARELSKAAKGRGKAQQAIREDQERKFDRWRTLAATPKVRVDCMIKAQADGRAMKVYF